MKKYLIFGLMVIALFSTRSSLAQKLSDFGLKEGDLISAIFSDDPDVYIINDQGYKRLFLNPEIFKFYVHLGGFFNVKLVTKEVVNAFPTSGLFRDCESNDSKVYGVDISGEDTGKLHWVNTTGDQAVKDDPDFFKKVFCVNNAEFNWYPKGNELETVKDIPNYDRIGKGIKHPVEEITASSSLKKIGQVVICHYPRGNPSQTITVNASSVKAHLAQGDTMGQCLVTNPTNSPVVISGVSGSQVLNVNEQGTWSVTASDASGGTLSYSVVWGDEVYATPVANSTSQYPRYQSATLTHTYLQAGTYTPTFTVTNSSGQSAKTSLSVNVGGVTTPSVTVLSPNGGETWAQGTTQTVKWRDNSPLASCPVGATNCYISPPAPKFYDITLDQYNPPCVTNICPMYLQRSYTIAKSVSGSSYDWKIPNCTTNSPCSSNFEIPTGSYIMQVCQTGTATCDSSDSYFKIISGGGINSSPVISKTGFVNPTNVTVGQSAFFKWYATDADNDDLSWGVDWGEGIGTMGTCQVNPPKGTGQNWNYTASYVWAKAGTYTVKITVNDCHGGSDSSSFTINVSAISPRFSINPTKAAIKVGDTTEFQALYDNCPTGAACFAGPLPVQATWTSSNSKVATVAYKDTCPPGANCFVQQLDYLTAVVTGVSGGTATITGTYKDSSGTVLTVSAFVTVESVSGCLGGPVGCVKISSLSPTSGPVGTNVTIYGSGFTMPLNCYPYACDPIPGSGNTINFGSGIIRDVYSYNGTSLTFQVPSSLTPACYYSQPACKIATVITQLGVYDISVTNANGTSNALNFTVVNLVR